MRASQTLVDGVTKVLSTWTGPQSVTTPPAAPSNVQAVSVSASEVDVTWTNNSSNQTGFNIYRSTGGGSFTLIGTGLSTDTEYEDLTAQPGTQYDYEVAPPAGGESAASESAPLTSIPADPSGLMTSTAADPNVTVSWNDVAGETGFNIQAIQQRRRTLGRGRQHRCKGVTQYTDTTSAENAMYEYRVQAFNGSGNSDFSSPASASTFLAAPTGLTITSTTGTEVDLSWTDHSAAATGYEVQPPAMGGGTWVSLTTSLAAPLPLPIATPSVADGTSYTYRVRGLSVAGNSDFTQTVSTSTTLLVPDQPDDDSDLHEPDQPLLDQSLSDRHRFPDPAQR